MIRKTIQLLLVFLLTSYCLEAIQATGYIIDTNNDTSQVTVYIPVFSTGHLQPLEFQKNPSLIVNGKKEKLNLGRVKEIGFEHKNLQFIFRKIVFFIGGRPSIKLKHLVYDGKVQVYRNYFKPNFMGKTIASEVFLVNENSESHFPRLLAFRKKIRKFLRGCPKFDNIVQGRKFKRKEIPAIIAAYNDQW